MLLGIEFVNIVKLKAKYLCLLFIIQMIIFRFDTLLYSISIHSIDIYLRKGGIRIIGSRNYSSVIMKLSSQLVYRINKGVGIPAKNTGKSTASGKFCNNIRHFYTREVYHRRNSISSRLISILPPIISKRFKNCYCYL